MSERFVPGENGAMKMALLEKDNIDYQNYRRNELRILKENVMPFVAPVVLPLYFTASAIVNTSDILKNIINRPKNP